MGAVRLGRCREGGGRRGDGFVLNLAHQKPPMGPSCCKSVGGTAAAAGGHQGEEAAVKDGTQTAAQVLSSPPFLQQHDTIDGKVRRRLYGFPEWVHLFEKGDDYCVKTTDPN